NGTGVAGVNWQVSLMALKFTDASGSGFVSDAIQCMDYAVANGAKVINASWSFASYSQALVDAVARARAAGVLVVASAGNLGNNIDTQAARYPASIPSDNLIAVAATTSTDALASYSSFGGKVPTGGRIDLARAIQDDGVPPDAPVLSPVGADRGSVSFSWTAPGDDGAGGGQISSYGLAYAQKSTGTWLEAPPPTVQAP